MNFKKLSARVAAMLLVLCMLAGCVVFAEKTDEGIEPGDAEEELLLEEDEDFLEDEDDETSVSDVYIDETVSHQLEDLDTERDTSVNPDDLELNTNLPDNVVNILLIGVDTRSKTLDEGMQHGDVQMILSVNTENGDIKISSLLRDLYVTIPTYKNKNRINLAYARGGGQLAMRTINHNFELNIQDYVTVNFYGLASIIDALGGVDIEMTKTEAGAVNTYLRKHPPVYDNATEKRTPLEKKSGIQHCDGIQAVMYARLRSIDNDFSRTARQRKLMEILLKSVMNDFSLDKLMSLMETSLTYAKTNMSGKTMYNLASRVLSGGLLQKVAEGGELIGQFRIPMDKTYSYATVNGDSVIKMGSKSFPKNVQALHEFIYGAYYPAN